MDSLAPAITSKEAAHWLLDQGIVALPVFGSDKGAARGGWQKLTIAQARSKWGERGEWAKETDGVTARVTLLPDGRQFISIDFDREDLKETALSMFPECPANFGSKGAKIYLFVSNGAVSGNNQDFKFYSKEDLGKSLSGELDPKLVKPLIEFPLQAKIQGINPITNKPYFWLRFCPIPTIEFSDVMKRVEEIADKFKLERKDEIPQERLGKYEKDNPLIMQIARGAGLNIQQTGFSLCPFHNDRIPSLYLKWGHAHCFGSGCNYRATPKQFAKDLEQLQQKQGFIKGAVPEQNKLLELFLEHIEKNVKMETLNALLLFQICLSAYTKEPINCVIKGETSTGKSHLTTHVIKYFPKEDVIILGGLSRKALFHSGLKRPQTDEEKERGEPEIYDLDLTNKILVFLDEPEVELLMALKPILSHDEDEIVYKTTEGEGKKRTKETVIKGHPACIYCETKTDLPPELQTRFLVMSPKMCPSKYKQAVTLTGKKNVFPKLFEEDYTEKDPLFRKIRDKVAFYREALANKTIILPFAEALAQQLSCKRPRIMRDYGNFLTLVRLSTWLLIEERPRCSSKGPSDEDIEITIATQEDYELANLLFSTIFESTSAGVPSYVLDFYNDIVDHTEAEENTRRKLTNRYNATAGSKLGENAIDGKFLNPLADIGLLTKGKSEVDKREIIFYAEGDAKTKSSKLVHSDFIAFYPPRIHEQVMNQVGKIYMQNEQSCRAFFSEFYLPINSPEGVNKDEISSKVGVGGPNETKKFIGAENETIIGGVKSGDISPHIWYILQKLKRERELETDEETSGKHHNGLVLTNLEKKGHIKVKFIKEHEAVVGPDLKTYGPFAVDAEALIPKALAAIMMRKGDIMEVSV